jgi:hypothetical protein
VSRHCYSLKIYKYVITQKEICLIFLTGIHTIQALLFTEELQNEIAEDFTVYTVYSEFVYALCNRASAEHQTVVMSEMVD